MATLFTTIDAKRNIVPTKGTYTIARKGTKIQPLIIVESGDYENGTAEDRGTFQEGDTIYIYPEEYLGMFTRTKGDVPLKEGGLAEITLRKAMFIQNKVG